MALITYLTRVHFADGVLEEALHSELEQSGRERPVVIADAEDFNSTFADRLFSSFPMRTKPVQCEVPRDMPAPGAMDILRRRYSDHKADGFIAFGMARPIQLAQFGRAGLASTHSTWTGEGNREQGRRKQLPPLFAIPGIDGLSASAPIDISEFHRLGNSRYSMADLLPTAIICDPTLTLGATAPSSASAGVHAMARCIEAYLSNAYNPPADGIALDGLKRCAGNLHRVLRSDRIEIRREMMAAGLDGALAQQKGVGTGQALAAALNSVVGRELDPGALARLLLPGIVHLNARALKEKYQPIRQILGIRPRQSLADGLRSLFEPLPLPGCLSDMGIEARHLDVAAAAALDSIEHALPAKMPKRSDLTAIMQAVL